MRHKLVTALCIVAVFTLIGLSVGAWHHAQVQRDNAATQASAVQAKQAQTKQAALAAEQKRVNDECHKGQASYDAQTAAYKKLHPTDRPVCDLPIVQ